MEKTKKKLKLWVKLTIIFSSIIVGLGVVLGGAILYFRLPVNAYYKASQKAFIIPEINDGYVPQGFHYDQKTDTFIMSGYMTDHSASPVYVVSRSGKLLKKFTLGLPDGKTYKGHGGGVACSDKYLYVTGGEDCCLYVYSYEQLITAKSGTKLDYVGKFSLYANQNDYIGNAFVTVVDGRLITGEFYRAGDYPTLPSHKITTTAGDKNTALAIEYQIDDSAELGINPTPVKAYSMPSHVQGLTLNDGKIYLSTSWGLSFSHILEYDELSLNRESDITLLGHNLPLYSLDSASLIKDYKLPPMSEEMAFVNGKLYVHSESASNKYIFGKFTGGKWIYKTDLTKMK
ncbi:MAG: hypothetical protein IJV99_02300 [Clostridia bacterium]|nr:hypothetical protein [Clostridia bacterium]